MGCAASCIVVQESGNTRMESEGQPDPCKNNNIRSLISYRKHVRQFLCENRILKDYQIRIISLEIKTGFFWIWKYCINNIILYMTWFYWYLSWLSLVKCPKGPALCETFRTVLKPSLFTTTMEMGIRYKYLNKINLN